MNKKIVLTVFLLAIFSVIIIKLTNQKKEIPYENPKRRTIEKKKFIVGRFWPIKSIKIKSEISGIVENIYVSLNDSVEIGTPIAKLRIIPNPQDLELAKKILKQAKVELSQKQTEHDRNQILFEKDIIAKSEFESTALAYNNAHIEYQYALKNFQIAQRGFAGNLRQSPNIIKSTIKGRILNIPISKGMNIIEKSNFSEGNTIAIVVDNSQYVFEFKIGETDINTLHVGDTFNILVKAIDNRMLKACISEIKPYSENKDEKFTYLGKAYLLQTDKKIKSGFTGIAEMLINKKKQTLSIKEKNIIYEYSSVYVEIIVDGHILKKNISRGISDGIFTEILDGITLNDKIKEQ